MKNISIPTDDFLDVLNEFQKEIFSPAGSQIGYSWSEEMTYIYSEILTEFGLCYTFNSVSYNRLLRFFSVSSDFHFQKFSFFTPNYEGRNPLRMNLRNGEYKLVITTVKEYFEKGIVATLNGYLMIFHNSYELPSKSSTIIPINIGEKYDIIIEPQLNNIEVSLKNDDPME